MIYQCPKCYCQTKNATNHFCPKCGTELVEISPNCSADKYLTKVWPIWLTGLLLLVTCGLWSIFLIYQWSANLQYLTNKEYPRRFLTIIYAIICVLVICFDLAQSEVLSNLSTLLSIANSIFLLCLTIPIYKRNIQEANQESATISFAFGWFVMLLVIDFLFDIFPLGEIEFFKDSSVNESLNWMVLLTEIAITICAFCMIQTMVNTAIQLQNGQVNLSDLNKKRNPFADCQMTWGFVLVQIFRERNKSLLTIFIFIAIAGGIILGISALVEKIFIRNPNIRYFFSDSSNRSNI